MSDSPTLPPLVDLPLRDDVDVTVNRNSAPMHEQPALFRILNTVKDEVMKGASCSGGSGHAYLRTLLTREEVQTSAVAQGSGLVPPLPTKRG